MPSKGAQFLANRVGQDALTMASLLDALEKAEARIAELEAKSADKGDTAK